MMGKVFKCCVIFLLFAGLLAAPARAQERNREQMRMLYLESIHKSNEEISVKLANGQCPSCDGLGQALGSINFLRTLCGLEAVELSATLTERAADAALLMAYNGEISHQPTKQEGVDDALYERGSSAAADCNLAMFNWHGEQLLTEAVVQFVRDERGSNRYVLGHRRWLLYPFMRYTGVSAVQDEDGKSYAAMYVMDDSAQGVDYDMICFPSGGAFPIEYMSKDTPWSVSFNPDKYDLMNSTPYLILTERTSGAEFRFERLNTAEELSQGGYFILSGGRYGDGPAYIFMPDLEEYDDLMYGYEQNQIWDVRIAGMKTADGIYCKPIEYTVEMASLTPIAPSAVEISPRKRTLNVGESACLSAQVIPKWADDLSVTWQSSDEAVAVVDEEGKVHAVGEGTCEIIAQTVNGREDRIAVEVR